MTYLLLIALEVHINRLRGGGGARQNSTDIKTTTPPPRYAYLKIFLSLSKKLWGPPLYKFVTSPVLEKFTWEPIPEYPSVSVQVGATIINMYFYMKIAFF